MAPLKLWAGMSLGDFLCQEVPEDWPDEEFYWQPTIWTRVIHCSRCGNPCSGSVKWMPKRNCVQCPDGYGGGRP